jgi:hypothetical protein
VGPDGVQDVVLVLSGLSPQAEIEAVAVDVAGRHGWRSGTNPEGRDNAELIRSGEDPARAELLIQAGEDLAPGTRMDVTLQYRGGKTDRATLPAGRFDPGASAPAATASYRRHPAAIAARWMGQEASAESAEPGLVRVEVSGLPADRQIGAVAISDPAGIVWSAHVDPKVPYVAPAWSRPLRVVRQADPSRVDLLLSPVRNETGATLSLRIVYDDGTTAMADLEGGAAEVWRRAGAPPSATVASAQPGSDLHEMVSQGGTIRLAAGTYRLDRPLRLYRALRLIGEPGATLEFHARPGGPPLRSRLARGMWRWRGWRSALPGRCRGGGMFRMVPR